MQRQIDCAARKGGRGTEPGTPRTMLSTTGVLRGSSHSAAAGALAAEHDEGRLVPPATAGAGFGRQ